MAAFGESKTYRTMVLRNHGLLAMEGTASSIRGCILMKLSVSSGNSLDTLYRSIDGVPAQLPGLEWIGARVKHREGEKAKGKCEEKLKQQHGAVADLQQGFCPNSCLKKTPHLFSLALV